MQKKLIALAVAGLASSAAFAQSNVTVYGIADVAYVHSSATGSAKTSGIDSGGWSSSRIGFKGEEALSEGMKALFVLEYGITPDVNSGVGVTATGGGSARATWVGLQTSAGTLKAGRMPTLGKDATDKYDALSATTFSALASLQKGTGAVTVDTLGTTTATSTQRLSNVATFVSSNMAGFVLSGQYAFGGKNQTDALAYTSVTKQESNLNLGVDYTVGPLSLGFVHQRTRDNNAPTTLTSDKASENMIAGAYNFEIVKLMGTYQNVKRTTAGVTAATDKIWSVGVQVPVNTMSRVAVGYARANDGAAANADSSSWGVQFAYDLSKRTMLYAGYQRTSDDKGATGSVLSNTSARAVPVTATTSGTANGYGFGVKHSF